MHQNKVLPAATAQPGTATAEGSMVPWVHGSMGPWPEGTRGKPRVIIQLAQGYPHRAHGVITRGLVPLRISPLTLPSALPCQKNKPLLLQRVRDVVPQTLCLARLKEIFITPAVSRIGGCYLHGCRLLLQLSPSQICFPLAVSTTVFCAPIMKRKLPVMPIKLSTLKYKLRETSCGQSPPGSPGPFL